jgi:hypothetical protein
MCSFLTVPIEDETKNWQEEISKALEGWMNKEIEPFDQAP